MSSAITAGHLPYLAIIAFDHCWYGMWKRKMSFVKILAVEYAALFLQFRIIEGSQICTSVVYNIDKILCVYASGGSCTLCAFIGFCTYITQHAYDRAAVSIQNIQWLNWESSLAKTLSTCKVANFFC